jgi:hypothetical protein
MITDRLNPKAQYRPPTALSACPDHCAVRDFLSLLLFTFLSFLLYYLVDKSLRQLNLKVKN